ARAHLANAVEPTTGLPSARVNALAAHVALAEGKYAEAQEIAQRALDLVGDADPETACEGLEAIGRADRRTDIEVASRSFRAGLHIAEAHGLGLWRARALHEIGTIAFLRAYDATDLDAARRAA